METLVALARVDAKVDTSRQRVLRVTMLAEQIEWRRKSRYLGHVYTSFFKPPALSAVDIILILSLVAGVYVPECGVELRGY